MNTSLYKIK